jgi:Fe-S cluster biosynthesis and repair protein YggX
MARMVMCAKLGRELPGLDAPPFGGDLGQRIYDEISEQAFAHWQEHAKTLIGAYRLNLSDPAGRDFLRQQMEDFFFGENAQMPDWFGQGAPGLGGKGGAAPAKGGGGARRK